MSTSTSNMNESQLSDEHVFVVPSRAIKVPVDMSVWEKSEAYFEYLGFILALNKSIEGKSLDSKCEQSPAVENILKMLNNLDEWITQIPPTEQPQRFGNKSFRTWHAKLQEEGIQELQQALPQNLHRAIPEIIQYLYESFGNPTRIDYGTGHEMAFLMFLCCLFKIRAFTENDKVAVAIKVFNRYLQLVRRLQITYRMEPAGSHGVWSLDDYQFVPFIWGSSQLIGHPRIEPRHFVDQDVIELHAKQYMFLGCIEFISKVLSKFPVIQHVLFGSLLPIKPATTCPNARGACFDSPVQPPSQIH
ncbi:serine/threonine-protein phosphatase 2A activator-like isoform X3 [Vespa velutina]|uniref:serine/threonine-protein phosphatase 2A activator-like isoform X3 n=1 Tax=Vespa velutina TaxID=202808 RepID=UPI001FB4C961|nr:serine/threonine-protein phosphatase 2A activator-like isoform X3 [Vespa velutina]